MVIRTFTVSYTITPCRKILTTMEHVFNKGDANYHAHDKRSETVCTLTFKAVSGKHRQVSLAKNNDHVDANLSPLKSR